MRPTPAELAAGVRALLRETVRPELAADERRHQFRRLMAVLRDVRWDEAAFDLLKENAALEDMLRDCIASQPSSEAPWPPAIHQALRETSQPGSFAEANARNHTLRDAACAAIAVASSDKGGRRVLRATLVGRLLNAAPV